MFGCEKVGNCVKCHRVDAARGNQIREIFDVSQNRSTKLMEDASGTCLTAGVTVTVAEAHDCAHLFTISSYSVPLHDAVWLNLPTETQ